MTAADAGRRPGGGSARPGRPGSYPSALPVNRRRRRTLAGALAGLAFGVIASAASTTGGAALSTGQVNGRSPAPTVEPVSVSPLEVSTLRVSVTDRRQADLLPAAGPSR